MAVITVSRETGSGGSEIARRLSVRLGFRLLDRPGLEALLPSYGLDDPEVLDIGEWSLDPDAWGESDRRAYFELVNSCLSDLADTENFILLGRGGQCLFAGAPDALHLRIVAPPELRAQRLETEEHLGPEEARRWMAEREGYRRRYVKLLFGREVRDPLLYDLVLRRERLDLEACVRVAVQAFGQLSLPVHLPKKETGPRKGAEPERRKGGVAPPGFANASEAEFARILDFYHIRWEYEPTTFPLAWNEEGLVSEAFAPDFHLTDFDLYIELTTLRQSLVTKKNRKLRRMKNLYPDVNVRLFYRKDYEELLRRFGLLEGDKERSPE